MPQMQKIGAYKIRIASSIDMRGIFYIQNQISHSGNIFNKKCVQFQPKLQLNMF